MKYFFQKQKLALKDFDYSLSGFANRTNNGEYIGLSELYLKVLWLKNEANNFILISLDILYIPEYLSQKIYKYLKDKYEIKSEEIVFNATHTHSGPGIEKKFDTFINFEFIDYIAKCIFGIFDKKIFKKGSISFNTFLLEPKMWISRRKIGRNIKKFFLQKSMLMLPNKKNEIDEKIRLISFFDSENDLDLLFYNFSCHPVFNRSNHLSSDFIGSISKRIEDDLKIDTIFLQGFLGDIRPNFTTNEIKNVKFIDKLKILVNKEIFKKYSKNDFIRFCDTISSKIIENTNYQNTKITNNINSKKFTYSISSKSNNTKLKFIIKLILINDNLFISIPAEVNSKYYVHLSKEFYNYNVIPLGMADDIIGYLPFYKEVNEGGYEVESIVNYGVDSPFSEVSLKRFYFSLKKDICNFIKDTDNDR